MAARAKAAKTMEGRENVSTDSEVDPDADNVLVRRRKRAVRRKDPYRYDIEPEYKTFRNDIFKRDLKALEGELKQLESDEHKCLKQWEKELADERDRHIQVAEIIYDRKVQEILDRHQTDCEEIKKKKDQKAAALRRSLRAQLEAEKAKIKHELANLSVVVKQDLVGEPIETQERITRTKAAAEKSIPKRRRKAALNASAFRLQAHQLNLKDWEIHDDLKAFAINPANSRQTTTRGAMSKMEELAKAQDDSM
eukprot:TRINITY_DN27246_c0_g1_i1.p1 TRINITY_DN27246_c0_g1~~TRINITY_DN27246_c0_g1_i1.p1  ORF type:complete len:252 (+),score=53.67 TRINITY_DN27246_c0_g1_i1:190-945(+)